MTVHAGDDAIYKPARGEPRRVRVLAHTAKRVRVMVGLAFEWGTVYVSRCVSAERLEKVPGGGGLLDANESR